MRASDRTKTAETKIAKLCTGIVRHTSPPIIHDGVLGQRSNVKVTGHKVQKGDRVAVMSYKCALSSTQPLVIIIINNDNGGDIAMQ